MSFFQILITVIAYNPHVESAAPALSTCVTAFETSQEAEEAIKRIEMSYKGRQDLEAKITRLW